MIRSSVIDATGYNDLDTFPTLAEAIADARNSWNEDSGPQCFIMQDEDGTILATLLRDWLDEEICITAYHDGRHERHRCHYVLDDEGRYVKTDVTELFEMPTETA